MAQSYTPATGGGFAASRPLGSSPPGVEEALGNSRRPVGILDGPAADPSGGGYDDGFLLAFIGIVAIQFKSDHAIKMTDQGFHKATEPEAPETDFEPGGSPFPDEFTWKVDPTTMKTSAHPVSHTMGRAITLDVTVRNDHTRSVEAKITGRVVVAGVASGMQFESDTKVFPSGLTRVTLVSSKPLSNEIKSQRFQVQWTFSGRVTNIPTMSRLPYWVAFTSENELLTTAGEPRVASAEDVTYGRMAHAVDKAAGAGPKAHSIVEALVKKVPFNGDLGTGDTWFFARKPGNGADCISIARYIQAIVKLLGLEGDSSAVVVYLRPKGPVRWKSEDPADSKIFKGFPVPHQVAKIRLLDSVAYADFSPVEDPSPANPKLAGLNWPLIIHPTNSWFLRLIDDRDGKNNYEGCVKFTSAAKITRWYPAGTGLNGQESLADVINNVFKSLSWVDNGKIHARVL